MAQPTHALEASLRRIDRILSELNDQNQARFWAPGIECFRDTLQSFTQLSDELAKHQRLLIAYRNQYTGTHWVVKYLLESLLERAQNTARQLQFLHSRAQERSGFSPAILRQLDTLRLETHSMLEVEEKVLLRMLNLLNLPARVTVVHNRLQLIK